MYRQEQEILRLKTIMINETSLSEYFSNKKFLINNSFRLVWSSRIRKKIRYADAYFLANHKMSNYFEPSF